KGDSASSTTTPTPTPTTTTESAPRLSEELSWKSFDDEEVGSHEEGKESNYDSDDGSDKDSEETVKSRAGKDGDDD
nr:hypothetical protein [Tanacetum cinerariifolium]